MCAPGMITMWGGTDLNIPEGWLLCNGSTVSQNDYADLYQAIGRNFGGNPQPGQFYLPDLRGRFVRGQDPDGELDPDTKNRTDMQTGEEIGPTVGSVQGDAFQDHVHVFGGEIVGGGNIKSGDDYTTSLYTSAASALDAETPCRTSKETRPVNAYLIYIVKY
ncbi:MAG TPA: phage tail protein [Thermoanaerobaculia bacterium]|nr:phage tail protein [Thermoanaerobaculia bacterium]